MAGYQNLYLNQSETFPTSLTLTDSTGAPYNLSGFTVKSGAKRSYYASNNTITFTSNITDANNGVVTLSANASTTANVQSSTLVYDVILIDDLSGVVTRVLEGQIFVSPSVTRP